MTSELFIESQYRSKVTSELLPYYYVVLLTSHIVFTIKKEESIRLDMLPLFLLLLCGLLSRRT